jgi:hypothetical protein
MVSRAPLRSRDTYYVGAAAAICLLTLVVFLPLVTSLRTSLLTAEATDSRNAIRGIWVVQHEHSSPFTLQRDPYNGAPEGTPLVPAASIASPLQPFWQWVLSPAIGAILAYNLFLLVGVVATGFAAFALLYRLGFRFFPSLVGGGLVALNPWSIERAVAGAPAFNHAWCLVLLLGAVIRLRADPSRTSVVLAGLAYASCFLVAAYWGFVGAAFLGGYIAERLVAERKSALVPIARRVVTIGAIAITPLIPALVVFFLHHKTSSQALSNPVAGVTARAASPLASYFLPSPRNPLLGFAWSAIGPNDPLRERTLFFGYTTMALAAAAFVVARRGRFAGRQMAAVRIAMWTVPVAYLFSLPREVDIVGVPVYTPSALIGLVTSYYRVYARFGYALGIALAVLAVASLDRLWERAHGRLLVGVLSLLLVIEFLPGTLPVRAANVAPAYDTWLAKQPKGIVAHYPLPTDNELALLLEGDEYYYQRFTHQQNFALFGAGTGGTREEGIRLLARYVDQPLSLRILRAEGVRYVVVHDDIYRALHEPVPTLDPPAFRRVATFGDVRIFTIQPKPNPHLLDKLVLRYAPVLAALEGQKTGSVTLGPDGFLEPETYHHVFGWRWMTQSGVVQIDNPYSYTRRFRLTGHAFSAGAARTIDVDTPSYHRITSFTVPAYEAGLRLQPLTLPPGTTTVVFYANPGPQRLGASDPRQASIYVGPLKAVPLPDVSLRGG